MQVTDAEILAEAVAEGGPRSRITVVDVSDVTPAQVGQFLAMYRLGIVLKERPELMLRAVVEEWDNQRIVREIY